MIQKTWLLSLAFAASSLNFSLIHSTQAAPMTCRQFVHQFGRQVALDRLQILMAANENVLVQEKGDPIDTGLKGKVVDVGEDLSYILLDPHANSFPVPKYFKARDVEISERKDSIRYVSTVFKDWPLIGSKFRDFPYFQTIEHESLPVVRLETANLRSLYIPHKATRVRSEFWATFWDWPSVRIRADRLPQFEIPTGSKVAIYTGRYYGPRHSEVDEGIYYGTFIGQAISEHSQKMSLRVEVAPVPSRGLLPSLRRRIARLRGTETKLENIDIDPQSIQEFRIDPTVALQMLSQ